MGVTKVLLIASFAVLLVAVYLQWKSLFEVPPLPQLEDTWWGPRDPSKEDTEIRPFKINVSDEVSNVSPLFLQYLNINFGRKISK